MSDKRVRHSPDFKAKVAIEAIKGHRPGKTRLVRSVPVQSLDLDRNAALVKGHQVQDKLLQIGPMVF